MGQDMYSKHAETPTALSAHTSTGAAGVRCDFCVYRPGCAFGVRLGPQTGDAWWHPLLGLHGAVLLYLGP